MLYAAIQATIAGTDWLESINAFLNTAQTVALYWIAARYGLRREHNDKVN